MGNIETFLPDSTASIPWAADSPIQINFSINTNTTRTGLGLPSGTAVVSYFDPYSGKRVAETVLVGGSRPTLVSVVTGSLRGDAIGAIQVELVPNSVGKNVVLVPPGRKVPYDTVKKGLGIARNINDVYSRGYDSIFGINAYEIQRLPSDSSKIFKPLFNHIYEPGFLQEQGVDPNSLSSDLSPIYDKDGNFVGIQDNTLGNQDEFIELLLQQHCFPAGSKILLEDGLTKAIELIRDGDIVQSFNREGILVKGLVTETWQTENQPLVEIITEVGRFKVTPGHKFAIHEGGFKCIDEISIDIDFLVDTNGRKVKIREVLDVEDKSTVYNFTVAEHHTYIANGLRVHNESLSLYKPVTTAGILGASVGGQIGGYLADNTFASQLVARSAGSTVAGWIGDAITYEAIFDNKSLEVLALPNRFASSLIPNAVSLGAGEISGEIIDLLGFDDPLEQIAASTTISSSASYGVATAAESLLGAELAIKYFGANPVTDLSGAIVYNDSGGVIADLSTRSFALNLLNAGGAAAGSFAGVKVSDHVLNTDSRDPCPRYV